jgi:hypothetical protein
MPRDLQNRGVHWTISAIELDLRFSIWPFFKLSLIDQLSWRWRGSNSPESTVRHHWKEASVLILAVFKFSMTPTLLLSAPVQSHNLVGTLCPNRSTRANWISLRTRRAFLHSQQNLDSSAFGQSRGFNQHPFARETKCKLTKQSIAVLLRRDNSAISDHDQIHMRIYKLCGLANQNIWIWWDQKYVLVVSSALSIPQQAKSDTKDQEDWPVSCNSRPFRAWFECIRGKRSPLNWLVLKK